VKPALKSGLVEVIVLAAAAALLAAGSGFYAWRSLGQLCPTLDDTFIHLRFAWNLAHGHGFAFNPGEPLPGTTSPVWVLLLTPLALLGKPGLVSAAIVLSGLSFVATVLLTRRLALRLGLGRTLGLAAAGAVLLNGRLLFAGLSGMETDLFAALALALVARRLRPTAPEPMGPLEGALFGIAAMTRPEGYLLFLLVLGHHLLARRQAGERFRFPLAAVLAFAAVVLPYMIFSLATIHHPLPSTYVAKQADLVRDRLRYLGWTVRYLWLDNPVGALLVAVGIARALALAARRRLAYLASAEGLVAAWPLGYLIASAALTPMPFHFLRYQLPVLPFFLLLAALAVKDAAEGLAAAAARRGLTRLATTRTLAAALAALWLLPGAALLYRWPPVIRLAAKNILELHVATGRWLGRASEPGDAIATMDIGAIGFYSDRKILDLVGLVTPEIVPRVRGKGVTRARSQAVLSFLEEKRPQYLAVFPERYPGLADDRQLFQPLFQLTLPDNQISSNNWMVVYRCRFAPSPKAAPGR